MTASCPATRRPPYIPDERDGTPLQHLHGAFYRDMLHNLEGGRRHDAGASAAAAMPLLSVHGEAL
jgi:hypothetical protein